MRTEEKLSVIAENLEKITQSGNYSNDILQGNLYELADAIAEIKDREDVCDIAKTVIPKGNTHILAQFCRIYSKYFGDHEAQIPNPETAERANTVAIPEIGRLTEVINVLRESHILGGGS